MIIWTNFQFFPTSKNKNDFLYKIKIMLYSMDDIKINEQKVYLILFLLIFICSLFYIQSKFDSI
jgi:hypothetical protein